MLPKTSKKNRVMKNNTIQLPPLNAVSFPPALQEAINDFMQSHGDSRNVEHITWQMLECATAGASEIGLDTDNVLSFMFFYRRVNELVAEIEKHKTKLN